MRIKKHDSQNEYIKAGDVWVRNLTKTPLTTVQVSNLLNPGDLATVIHNQQLNREWPLISEERIHFEKVVIVSDGHKFDRRCRFLPKLTTDVAVFTVNGALRHWPLMNRSLAKEHRRTINAHVINNPYPESLRQLPRISSAYWPTCLASLRTHPGFLKKYEGGVYAYVPTPEEGVGVAVPAAYTVDDYRNPVCAAVALAYRFGARKILLVTCDDTFTEQRDYAVRLANGLWTYPQHILSQQITDAMFGWLAGQSETPIECADYSSGPEYRNARYITTEDEALSFFEKTQETSTDVEPTFIAAGI